jgi:hypothetical protein
MIDIRCACGETYHAEQSHLGKSIRCQKCGAILTIERHDHSPLAQAGEQSVWQRTVGVEARDSGSVDQLYRTKPDKMSRGTEILIGSGLAAIALLLIIVLWQTRPSPVPTPKGSSEAGDSSRRTPLSQGMASPSTVNTEPMEVPEIKSVKPIPLSTLPAPVPLIPPSAVGQQPERPTTGEAVVPSEGTTGDFTLEVKNGTNLDALVRLASILTGRTNRLIYVRAYELHTIGGIEVGVYSLRYITGSDFVKKRRRFLHVGDARIFEQSFEFPEGHVGGYTVTLRPVVGGTARTRKIDVERFFEGDQYVSTPP